MTASTFHYLSSICSRRGPRHQRQIDKYRDSKHRLLLTAALKGIFFLLYFHTQQIKVETPNVTQNCKINANADYKVIKKRFTLTKLNMTPREVHAILVNI